MDTILTVLSAIRCASRVPQGASSPSLPEGDELVSVVIKAHTSLDSARRLFAAEKAIVAISNQKIVEAERNFHEADQANASTESDSDDGSIRASDVTPSHGATETNSTSE